MKHPVIECFGPTIQGEGFLAGAPTHFVRFGGCGYRCSWCDSMYAVDPAEVRAHAEKLTAEEIVERVELLPGLPAWVTLSGGDPALHDLKDVVTGLHEAHYKVAVETQGSRWNGWLAHVDHLTVSPKPPSSGMAERAERELPVFLSNLGPGGCQFASLKIVVFDEADLVWAGRLFAQHPGFPAYVSCGTDRPENGEPMNVSVDAVLARYRWLCERVASDWNLAAVRVLPQLHVLAWGHARGV